MSEYAIPDNALFLKFTKFSETGLYILGMMPKKGISNSDITME